jgi:LysR family transcriptional regulator, low CO2-responsive transcriptional regulator
MPANRITTSSVSRRRLARSSSLSIGGRSERRAASGPSFGPRQRFLFALARLSFLSMIGGAERIDVKSAVIGEHPQVIIAPPDHPLAKQRSISAREIAKQTILMREVGSGTRLLAERFLAQHGIEPRIGMEIGSNETIKQAVMAGLGIAFISAHTIAAEIDDGRLAILDVAGLPEIRQWFVVHPATKRMMPAASSLRDFLVAEGRRFLPNLKHGRRGGKTPPARGNHSAKRK